MQLGGFASSRSRLFSTKGESPGTPRWAQTPRGPLGGGLSRGPAPVLVLPPPPLWQEAKPSQRLQLQQVFPCRATALRAARTWPLCTRVTSTVVHASSPDSHLAVHDVGEVELRQQVGHVEENLSVFLHNAVVARDEREQRVALHLLKTLILIFGELLQDGALVCCLEVT